MEADTIAYLQEQKNYFLEGHYRSSYYWVFVCKEIHIFTKWSSNDIKA